MNLENRDNDHKYHDFQHIRNITVTSHDISLNEIMTCQTMFNLYDMKLTFVKNTSAETIFLFSYCLDNQFYILLSFKDQLIKMNQFETKQISFFSKE
ncbi:hypothetical protein BpHYR1_038279 [Brachionus plicatilis]|uniref:Uncharacterized protein n=1 Tax=Brachionus plicatilis TaxID=10195 RepID=A0A3M7RW98_BRAPC|nr:hypothetical protein BpHYR1_038279 [Brachionus plicatilis]